MAATQYGTTLNLTGQLSITGMIVTEDGDGFQGDSEDTNDANGALVNRTVYNRHGVHTLQVIATGTTDIKAVFPPMTTTAVGGTTYWVEPYEVSKTKSAQKATVKIVALGF